MIRNLGAILGEMTAPFAEGECATELKQSGTDLCAQRPSLKGGKLILVVEDDPDIRETLADVLTESSYRVEFASNGQEALELLHIRQPALILTDLKMPVMDGWQFRAELLKDPKLAAIPVIVVSGGHLRPIPVRLAACLAKPIDLAALLSAVERCCA